jgi:RNA polymerase sigma-70 factor, ECF subfamily
MDQTRTMQVLIQKARDGDRTAFEQLAEAYRPRIEALIRSRLGRELLRSFEAEDVLQETLIRAFRSIGQFRVQGPGGESFLRWIGGIAEHVILTLARRKPREGALPSGGDTTPVEGLTQSKALRRQERFDRLEEALKGLSSEHREVILLARIECLSIKEVARRMGRSPGAVTQLLLRALKSLRASFGDTESFHLPPRVLGNGGEVHGD